MQTNEGTFRVLFGDVQLKTRVQHPKIHERKTKSNPHWYFRYWKDEFQPNGSVVSRRMRQVVGPSKGEGAITKKQAEIERDAFLARLNAPTKEAAAAKGVILVKELAQMYIESHLNRKVALPTRLGQTTLINGRIVPRWGESRLNELRPKAIEDWLFDTCACWNTRRAVRNVMRSMYSKAAVWGYWDENIKSPLAKVDIGKKRYKWERRILTEEETGRVLARIPQPHCLICEICLTTGARISEVLGLQLRHVDLAKGTIFIEQRNWHGDIDETKTETSRRVLTLADLTTDLAAHIASLKTTDPKAWVFSQLGDPARPMWDSGVRKSLKTAAAAEGLDFPGFGLHSFRRANISWRQKYGGSSIEASKIAGHANLAMTEHYTFVEVDRQRELTAGIRAALAGARKPDPDGDAERRERCDRLANARAAKAAKRADVVEMPKRDEAA